MIVIQLEGLADWCLLFSLRSCDSVYYLSQTFSPRNNDYIPIVPRRLLHLQFFLPSTLSSVLSQSQSHLRETPVLIVTKQSSDPQVTHESNPSSQAYTTSHESESADLHARITELEIQIAIAMITSYTFINVMIYAYMPDACINQDRIHFSVVAIRYV